MWGVDLDALIQKAQAPLLERLDRVAEQLDRLVALAQQLVLREERSSGGSQ